ncbi:hypothetical protein [Bradyrhizobium sp. HKCCYLS20291]|uniref:hypothetical protein n=1 Tax=Bradyrhizobium sp. HKCCYLS20291 TaxID=3420766 RepID=UPI003EB6ED4E
MMKEGTYSAWFKTPMGQGTGIVELVGGRICGGDAFLSYTGTYEAEGDRFTALLRTRRHAPGQPSLFGPDELTLSLEGSCKGSPVTCRGHAAEAPDVPFEAILLFSQTDATVPSPRPQRSSASVQLPKPIWR